MPKRKPLDSDNEEDTEKTELKKSNKKQKEPDNSPESKQEASLLKKTVKKPKAHSFTPKDDEPHTSSGDNPDVSVHTNAEGEKYIDIGRNRRATVRMFKNVPLLDIREYYAKGTEVMPGKKGISLKLDEWETLKQSTHAIDKLFSSIKE